MNIDGSRCAFNRTGRSVVDRAPLGSLIDLHRLRQTSCTERSFIFESNVIASNDDNWSVVYGADHASRHVNRLAVRRACNGHVVAIVDNRLSGNTPNCCEVGDDSDGRDGG